MLEEIRKSRQDLSKAFEMIQPVTGQNWPTPGLGAIGCSVDLEAENAWESRCGDVRDSLDNGGEQLGDGRSRQARQDTSSLSTVRNRLGDIPTRLDNANESLIHRMRDESKNHLGDMQTCLDNARDSLVATRAGSELSDRNKAD